ncbi:protein scabrous isoform X1 [Ostrinia furnacalis]|uniref:protein scabrous isoform X1 n=1 Tax=Ostrinia furnacalis TaxID=93504 RepID=UPI00103CE61E|nr:protein scabrous isoform X1 [Ostrinia furnacalis]
MKCIKTVLMTLICILINVNAAEMRLREEMQAMAEQLEILKTNHLTDVTRLKREVAELKQECQAHTTNNHERNEQATLQWAKTSMHELRVEMKELGESVNNSVLLRQLHNMRNELKQALMENSDLAQLARTQEARVDKMDNELSRIKFDVTQMRGMVADLRGQLGKVAKEVSHLQTKLNRMEEYSNESYNDVLAGQHGPMRSDCVHKLRHNKMVHSQISRLARAQNQMEVLQQNLQTQILDVERRMDRFEEPNWNLITAKVDYLEVETKNIRTDVSKNTEKVSDFDKIHASMLELREDVESIENKADKTIPEFRKEISKLDVNFAQLNAASSYLREDQENLRQSVKAIAVSVSNAIDRAETDRVLIKTMNDTICKLETSSKQHFYRLNDHILKSEANNEINGTETISLPELMGEVKELQPVEREYEDLVNQLPRDCSSVSGPPGTYLIHPGNKPLDTWCADGSTLLQRRYNGSIEFNRKFAEYVHGFGNPASEYWLGLETMHLLTADNCTSMRIDMTDIYGGVWYAEYDQFSVGSADSGYVLNVSGFKGNASDAFEYQNHMEFSAIDRDRDISNTHCASNYEGGWWFSHCQHVNINGKYTLGLTWFDSARNEWIAVATSEMRLSRRRGCA